MRESFCSFGKFLRVQKVFAHIIEKNKLKCQETFRTARTDIDISSWFDYLPGVFNTGHIYFWIIQNFPDTSKTVRIFQDD